MGAALDNPLRCENPRLFNASAKSVLHTSQGDSADIRKRWGGQWVRREGPSQWRGNDQFVGETAQVTRCMDLELDEAAPRPLIWMDVPSDLLVMCNTRCLFDISTIRNWFSGCQNSTWVDHEIPSFNVMLYGFWTCFQAWKDWLWRV